MCVTEREGGRGGRTHLLGIWDRAISPPVRREKERKTEEGRRA